MAAVLGAPALRFVAPGDAVLPALVRLIGEAYPILEITSADKLADFVARAAEMAGDPGARWVAAERDGQLVGAMRLYDYAMNVRGRDALTGGLGSVAVALAHKRQGIARGLVRWYLDHFRERGGAFAVLHPFRPDFYRALGFGYGTPTQRYRFAPTALRAEGARGTARLLGAADADAVLACTERVRGRTNGLIAKHRAPLERALRDESLRYVGVEDAGVLRGFMQTAVALERELVNRNALTVRDLHAEDDAALAALLGYLRAQRDQFREIVVESQDDAFYLAAADDPRDGSDVLVAPPGAHRVAEVGLGMMYRVIDVERAFAHLPAADAPFVLRLEVMDPFYPPTHGAWTFHFGSHGAPRHDAGAADATLRIGIAELSSLVVGSLDLHALVRHRLAMVEPHGALARVARAFAVDQRPICNTRF